MTDPAIIFQRTHTGRDEIHQKSHGLTQSERLVLIMVDGVSTYSEIRAKLPVLTNERFDRALQKLQLKELVLEVFMPVEDQAPDELERTVIDRFLQQDPMDPVTIMLQDPEEEFGLLENSSLTPKIVPLASTQTTAEDAEILLAPATTPMEHSIAAVAVEETLTAPLSEPALDARYAEMADTLAAEMRAIRASKPLVTQRPTPHMPQPMHKPALVEAGELSPFVAVHWGYWLIVSGLSFILGFVLARVTS